MLECNDSMKLHPNNRWLVTAILTIALALTACGSDDPGSDEENNTSSSPSSTTPTTPASDEDMASEPLDDGNPGNQSSVDMGTSEADMFGQEDMFAPSQDANASYDDDEWVVRIERVTPLHRPGPDGCLRATSELFAEGMTLDVIAANAYWILVDIENETSDHDRDARHTRGLLARADIEEVARPYALEELPVDTFGRVTDAVALHTWSEGGCPERLGLDLEALTEIEVLAKFHDASYKGWVVTDRALTLAPVRKIEADGMPFPWEAAVQLVKAIPSGGFVTGGGVLIGPKHILTAASLGVDETFCYSRAPKTELSLETLALSCNRIEKVTPHPRGVDLAILELATPEPGPHATLADTSPAPDTTFYTTDFSTLKRGALRDGTIARVGSDNANCEEWPARSTFASKEMLVSPGDAGGPAFQKDTLIGIVHGLACKRDGGEPSHLFINIAEMRDFIDAVLADSITP